MISSGEEFLTVAEVATLLKLNPQTVRNWIDRGELPALHVGRRVRIRRSELDQFLERGRTRTPQPDESPAQAFWEGELPPAPLEPPEHE
jgi:excisionase family DNA binding protein